MYQKKERNKRMLENEIFYTGTIRRIDDLNRITIPNDICKKAKINLGDPFEIYYTTEGEIILRPYDPYRLDRENIKKADTVLQTINNKINIIVFDKSNVIYSSAGQTTAPINNFAITEAMNQEYINENILEKEMTRLYPNSSVSINQTKRMVIVLVTSMGHDADTVIFDYLWKIICD